MLDREVPLHGKAVHEVVLFLGTDLDRGLSFDEARQRQERFGPNVLPPNRRHGPLVRFLLQFHNPLVYVLLAAGAATLAIGHLVDAAVIVVVVLVNAVIGYVQEWRAGQALEALAAATRTEATVVREGEAMRLDSRDIVPGDVVQVEAGDKVPADLRLTRVKDLHVDESSLTGESVPVEKGLSLLPVDTSLGDRLNMAYSSTLATAGSGTGVVVATGVETEIGRIHQLVGQAEGVQTPLTRKLARFSRWLTVVILGLAVFTFAIGLLRGEDAAEMMLAAVALSVSAIPEGLPAAVTITLAIGVSRMARRHAIIRQLPAAETLGSTTVICTDKTGTLTENRMTVQFVYAHGQVHEVGSGRAEHVGPCLQAGVLCNNADLAVDEEGRTVGIGDPTEVALLLAASSRDVLVDDDHWTRIDELPFSSDLRLMATLHQEADRGTCAVWVKGAVEQVLDLCVVERDEDGGERPVERDRIERHVRAFGEKALRVLAFAVAEVPRGWSFEGNRLRDLRMTFLGLQAMADPPRPEAIRAVAACRSAGIEVKMITGDHAHTARAIARQIGLAAGADGEPNVLEGLEMQRLSGSDLAERVDRADVLARVSAAQKLEVVELLQRRGHVVAMTGDGVNDAPALKQADIGVAMGRGGTEVAKEASAMVLTDDDFASVEAAVEEGRSVFDNLTKFIIWTLPTSLGEALVVLSAIVLGAVLPVMPVQILWINMTTAVALGLMLAFEPAEPGIMDRPPRAPDQPILTAVLVRRIVLVGALMLVGAFGAYEMALGSGLSVEAARTIVVNAFVAMEIGYLLNCRALDRSVLSVGLLTNRPLLLGVGIMITLQLLLTYLPVLQTVFRTEPMSWVAWAGVVILGVVVFLVVGIDKWLVARRLRSAAGRAPR